MYPHFGQTHCPPGPAEYGPPILPLPPPPPLGGPDPSPLGIIHRPFRTLVPLFGLLPTQASTKAPAQASTESSAQPSTCAHHGSRPASAEPTQGIDSRKQTTDTRPVREPRYLETRADSRASTCHWSLTHRTCSITSRHFAHLLPLMGILYVHVRCVTNTQRPPRRRPRWHRLRRQPQPGMRKAFWSS